MSAAGSSDPQPGSCEWCGQSSEALTLCARCRMVRAEQEHIWDHIEGRRW